MNDIAALRDALSRATPGPWRIINDDSGDRPVEVPSIQASEDLDCAIIHWDGFWQEYWQSARGNKEMRSNAALIVAAVNALGPLCDEVEALRKALQNIKYEAERENGGFVHLKRAIAVQTRAALGGHHA